MSKAGRPTIKASSTPSPSKSVASSTNVTPKSLFNDTDGAKNPPTKKMKMTEVIQIGVVITTEYGDCAVEIKNGYPM